MAAACPQQLDTCSTCAQQHRTVDCTRLDYPHCISCDCNGHASWDRACPTFMRKCAELNERAEDNNMPCFPTLETWTQAMEPTNPTQINNPPRRPQPQHTTQASWPLPNYSRQCLGASKAQQGEAALPKDRPSQPTGHA